MGHLEASLGRDIHNHTFNHWTHFHHRKHLNGQSLLFLSSLPIILNNETSKMMHSSFSKALRAIPASTWLAGGCLHANVGTTILGWHCTHRHGCDIREMHLKSHYSDVAHNFDLRSYSCLPYVLIKGHPQHILMSTYNTISYNTMSYHDTVLKGEHTDVCLLVVSLYHRYFQLPSHGSSSCRLQITSLANSNQWLGLRNTP